MDKRRRGRQWTVLGHGVRAEAAAEDPFWAQLHGWTQALPRTAVLTGPTALRIWGVPLPVNGLPLWVAVPRRLPASKRSGVRTVRLAALPECVSHRGVLVARPAEALLTSARDLGHLDLVSLIDAALFGGVVSVAAIDAQARSGRPGCRALQSGLAAADGRAESLWESLLRVLHRSLGVEVDVQAPLVDLAGRPFGRADLLLTSTRTLHEYDGGDHRTVAGQARDMRRDRRLVDAGYVRRAYGVLDVTGHPEAIAADALRTVGREWHPSELEPWRELWSESLFSDSGRKRVIARWGETNC